MLYNLQFYDYVFFNKKRRSVIVKSKFDCVVKYRKVTNNDAPKWSETSALSISKPIPNRPKERTISA